MAESGSYQPFDLFVSYAHVDNEDGWVRKFVAKLGAALTIRNGGNPLSIYFDTRELQANKVLDDMLVAARNARFFLAIGSRAYVERGFTIRELTAFNDAVRDPSRIFVIETLPLLPGREWPGPIREHVRQPFFVRDETDGTENLLSAEADPVRFVREVNKLAEHIVRKIIATNTTRAVAAHGTSTTPASLAPGFERKRVLIAQPTEALDDSVEELRNYLMKYQDGVQVLPEAPYPQGGPEFKAAYLLDLDRADLVVQLLDRRRGRRPPDLPEGYAMFQRNATLSHKVEIIQWRHPAMDLNEIADEEYRRLLIEPTVVACGFQAFMESVRKRAVDPVAKDRPKNGVVIYVHAAQNDMNIARRIGESCGKYKLFCHLPQFDRKTINTREVQDRLSTSNAVLLLYCNADVGWARREAEEVFKYRRRDDSQVIALCFGPPSDKPDMNVIFPDARIIVSGDEEEFLFKIDTLLQEIAA